MALADIVDLDPNGSNSDVVDARPYASSAPPYYKLPHKQHSSLSDSETNLILPDRHLLTQQFHSFGGSLMFSDLKPTDGETDEDLTVGWNI